MGMPPQALMAMMQGQGQGGQGQPPGSMAGGPPMPPDPTQQLGMPPQGPAVPTASGQEAPMESPQDPDEEMDKYLDYARQDSNLAKRFAKKDPELMAKMGDEIIRGFTRDVESISNWTEMNKKWLEMAMLVRTGKTYPWPHASDVKYPLLATAAMQFSARAYPALVPSDGEIVKVKIQQQNPQDQLYQAAQRVSAHMSYQVLNTMPNWEEDMDKLLMTMAITGICFKKTYHSSLDGCHHSHLVYPENFVINYNAKSIEKAYRKSEILKYNQNELQEKINNDEEFLDVELTQPPVDNKEEKPSLTINDTAPPVDSSTPHVFIACHTFWDLDEDGYEEPYVITVHKATRKVVRIIARWDQDGVKRNDDKTKITKIEPVEYFTAFPFIPNPDGSLYGLGFGLLLSPLNASVNTLINLLVDAGHLSNMQAGFIGKGLRLKMGDTSLRPGEWKVVNATGDDLSKSVYPMPVREPSSVLFQLLNLLITSGNQLASIAEIFVGKMPGQNTPATTTQETIQQGMAVFTAIYKRVYRSLAQEFKKLYRLNRICPDIVEQESKTAGIQLQSSDYDLEDYMIMPGADPTGDSQTVRMAKLQQVGSLIQLQTINPMEYTKRVLDANEIPNAQALLAPPQQPQPDPKQATEQEKQNTLRLQQQGIQQKQAGDAAERQQKQAMAERMAALDEAQKQLELRHQVQMQALEHQGKQADAQHNQVLSAIENFHTALKGHLALAQSQAKHELSMTQAQQAASTQ